MIYRKILKGETSNLSDFTCNMIKNCQRYSWQLDLIVEAETSYPDATQIYLQKFGSQVIFKTFNPKRSILLFFNFILSID